MNSALNRSILLFAVLAWTACGSDDGTDGAGSGDDAADTVSDSGVTDADQTDVAPEPDVVAPDATDVGTPDVPVEPDGDGPDAAPDTTDTSEPDPDTDAADPDAEPDVDPDATEPDAADGSAFAPQTCADLDCSALERTCIEGTGDSDGARCGDCLEGFVDTDGICQPVECTTADECAAPVPGPFGECERPDTSCSTSGSQRRNIAVATCTDGVCGATISEQVTSCTAVVTGQPCAAAGGLTGACDAGGACIIPADAPLVDAIDGDVGVVTLRIISPADTDELRIFRDSELVDTITPNASGQTIWRDTTVELSADEPGTPTALSTTAVADGIELRWTPPPLPVGPSYSYVVRAVVDGTPGNASSPDLAAALGPEPDGLRVFVGSTARPVAAPTQPYLIPWNALPPGGYETITATAGSPPSEAWVALRLTGYSAVNGPDTSVNVQLENVNGRGEAATTTVNAQPGTPTVQWERGTAADAASLAAVSGLTGASVNDVAAPADGTVRYYRASLSHPAAVTATSPIVSGRRSVPRWGQTCTSTTVCGVSGAVGWCPTNTSERRCAPRPFLPTGLQMSFQYIPAGSFSMGSPTTEIGRNSNEDQHTVQLTRPFAIARTELTLGEWRALTGGVDPDFLDPDCDEASCPATGISWYSALEAANAVSAAANLPACYTGLETCFRPTWITGRQECDNAQLALAGANVYECQGYRLCTEAEWEYAARAGVTTATHGGNLPDATATCYASSLVDPWEWYCSNSGGNPQPVASRQSNAWGLFDVLGNAQEWTWDQFAPQLGTAGLRDPFGTIRFGTARASRAVRGGILTSRTPSMRFAWRLPVSPGDTGGTQGVRLCRTLPAP